MRCHQTYDQRGKAARQRRRAAGQRPGAVAVAVLALLAVALALFAIWTKAQVREYRQLKLRGYQLQSKRLAEAGLHRAEAQLRRASDYDGELWQIGAEQLGGRQGGVVEIRVERQTAAEEPTDTAIVRVSAQFPHHAQLRARHTVEAALGD